MPSAGVACHVALVAVRHAQLVPTTASLGEVAADVVFFGNAAGLTARLCDAVGSRAMFGFPAAGGVRAGGVIRYVAIRQQKTMLADPTGNQSPRVTVLGRLFRSAGFPTHVSVDAEAWLIAHAAFIVPIAFALYRVDVQPARLAANPALLRVIVRATRECFNALQASGNTEIPHHLRALYLRMPKGFA